MKAFFLLLLFSIPSYITAQTTSWDGTTWSNGLPDISVDAEIVGHYDTSMNPGFSANNINVTATGSVIIGSGTTIVLQNNLDNLGAFTIENGGSLIMIDDAGTVFGNYLIKRNTPNNPDIYSYSFFSSPMIEEDSNINTIFNPTDIIYYWDTTQDPTYYVYVPHEDAMGESNKLGLGKGYSVAPTTMTGVVTRTFTGKMNTGDITVPVYYSDSSSSPGQFGYNIIGNPYPSAIDWFAFKADNASILAGSMYLFRDQTGSGVKYGSDYIAVNKLGTVPYDSANEFIGSAQGFVAKAYTAGNVVFKNSHRVANNEQFFRNSTQSRLNTTGNSWLKILGTAHKSTILIGFNSNGTVAFDEDYDGSFIGGADPLQFYSLLGAEKLLMNAQPDLTPSNTVSIPLGIKVESTGFYKISIEEEFIDSDYLIKLEDTQTSTITDLRLSDYNFNVSSTSEDNTRFIIHYEYDTTLSNDDVIDENDLKIYFNNNDLNLIVKQNKTLPTSVSIYDVNGKLIQTNDYNSVITTNNLSSGVYLVKVNFDASRSFSIKVVKK